MEAIRRPSQATPPPVQLVGYKILIVGEAWGTEEAKLRRPFVGPSGQELTRMLGQAGIRRAECYLTNVFNLHPPGNDIDELCGPKDDALPEYPRLGTSRYVRAEFSVQLDRLRREILDTGPNVIIALGNTSMWALLGRTQISKFRGVVDVSTHTVRGVKVLPTYHPAAVLRDWSLRPTALMDLAKARKESEYPELRRPVREIWIEPTLSDMETFRDRHIRDFLSIDIETAGRQITCIGFAPSPSLSLVVPFFDSRRGDRNYWSSQRAERDAWGFVRGLLEDPGIRKVFQNGLYDIAFIWRTTGIKVLGAEHDTMLLHHALQPEALKGLGYLGSVYTDEGAWKEMRGSTKTIKRDE